MYDGTYLQQVLQMRNSEESRLLRILSEVPAPKRRKAILKRIYDTHVLTAEVLGSMIEKDIALQTAGTYDF